MDVVISDVEILPLENPRFLRPFRMRFRQNGVQRDWECAKSMSSVSVLIYDSGRDGFVFVKQFRPALWNSQKTEGITSEELGFSYELCAGLLDKNLSHEQTVKEEILEECGYDVSELKRITMTYGAFGFSANIQTMFYARVDESMRVGRGGGVDDEMIEQVFIPRDEMDKFIFDESKPKGFGLLFAYLWWKDNFNKGNL